MFAGGCIPHGAALRAPGHCAFRSPHSADGEGGFPGPAVLPSGRWNIAGDTALAAAEILIVDDEEAIVHQLRRALQRAGFRQITTTTDPREVVDLCLWKSPDLILLDLHMPYLDGVAVIEALQALRLQQEGVPVLVLSGDITTQARQRVLQSGARDYLPKPCDLFEVVLRVRNHLETRFLYRELQEQNQRLEERVRARTLELEEAQREVMERLARAAEYRDDDTGEHAKRVGDLAASIADELGLPAEQVEWIWRAATLHDVGKIGISDGILLKPGKLTPEEMSTMRTHTRIGAEILSGGRSDYIRMAEVIALTHHEWWDGNGYAGLAGEEIPIAGRIVAIADVFDALTHERPYKTAWSVDDAVAHIVRLKGRHFDPQVVDAFLRVLEHTGVLPLHHPIVEPAADSAAEPPADPVAPVPVCPAPEPAGALP